MAPVACAIPLPYDVHAMQQRSKPVSPACFLEMTRLSCHDTHHTKEVTVGWDVTYQRFKAGKPEGRCSTKHGSSTVCPAQPCVLWKLTLAD